MVDAGHVPLAVFVVGAKGATTCSPISGCCALEGSDGRIVGEARSLGGFPVDGFETVLKVAGWAELPLADDGPDSSSSCNARTRDDKTNDYRLWQERRGLVLGSIRGRRRRCGLGDKDG